MRESIPFAQVERALTRLGFARHEVVGSHVEFRHGPTDTVFLFPAQPTPVYPTRVASMRFLAIGRGVTTDERFDEAFGAPVVASQT